MRLYWLTGIAAFLALVALVVSLGKHPARIDTSAFVRRSEIGMDGGALNQVANEVIQNTLRAHGEIPQRLVIIRQKIDGSTATVVEDASWSSSPNGPSAGAEITLIFRRTPWTLVQTTASAIPAS